MDYARTQRQPGRHAVGLSVVVLLHLLLGWALLNGLARKVVEVIKAPIETKIIEEVKPPPPPPPEKLPPPPKNAPPPPSFVPPPEVAVAPPPTPQPQITATTAPPPPAPVQIAPPPAPVAAAPAPPAPPPPAPKAAAQPARIDVASCTKPEYPPAAARAEATGTTKIRFTVDADGHVAKAEIERPSGPTREHKLLDRTAAEALGKCRFQAGIDDSGKPVGAVAIVDYVWKLD